MWMHILPIHMWVATAGRVLWLPVLAILACAFGSIVANTLVGFLGWEVNLISLTKSTALAGLLSFIVQHVQGLNYFMSDIPVDAIAQELIILILFSFTLLMERSHVALADNLLLCYLGAISCGCFDVALFFLVYAPLWLHIKQAKQASLPVKTRLLFLLLVLLVATAAKVTQYGHGFTAFICCLFSFDLVFVLFCLFPGWSWTVSWFDPKVKLQMILALTSQMIVGALLYAVNEMDSRVNTFNQYLKLSSDVPLSFPTETDLTHASADKITCRWVFWGLVFFSKWLLMPLCSAFWHVIIIRMIPKLMSKRALEHWSSFRRRYNGHWASDLMVLFITYHMCHKLVLFVLIEIALRNDWLSEGSGLNFEIWNYWFNWILIVTNVVAICKYTLNIGNDLDMTISSVLMVMLPFVGADAHFAKDWLFIGVSFKQAQIVGRSFHGALAYEIGVLSILSLFLPTIYFLTNEKYLSRPSLAANFVYNHWPIVGAEKNANQEMDQRSLQRFVQEQAVDSLILQSTPWHWDLIMTSELPQGLLELIFSFAFRMKPAVLFALSLSFVKLFMFSGMLRILPGAVRRLGSAAHFVKYVKAHALEHATLFELMFAERRGNWLKYDWSDIARIYLDQDRTQLEDVISQDSELKNVIVSILKDLPEDTIPAERLLAARLEKRRNESFVFAEKQKGFIAKERFKLDEELRQLREHMDIAKNAIAKDDIANNDIGCLPCWAGRTPRQNPKEKEEIALQKIAYKIAEKDELQKEAKANEEKAKLFASLKEKLLSMHFLETLAEFHLHDCHTYLSKNFSQVVRFRVSALKNATLDAGSLREVTLLEACEEVDDKLLTSGIPITSKDIKDAVLRVLKPYT